MKLAEALVPSWAGGKANKWRVPSICSPTHTPKPLWSVLQSYSHLTGASRKRTGPEATPFIFQGEKQNKKLCAGLASAVWLLGREKLQFCPNSFSHLKLWCGLWPFFLILGGGHARTARTEADFHASPGLLEANASGTNDSLGSVQKKHSIL